MSNESGERLIWHRALAADELPEGRVSQVTCEHWTVCMTNVGGTYAAIDNRCPHQGGPLGEGSIENGMLRCPWPGWDFDPLTGKPPGGFDDGVQTNAVEVRDDGVYVGFPAPDEHVRTVSDLMAETMANWGVRWIWGMVGHSNLGLADALRRHLGVCYDVCHAAVEFEDPRASVARLRAAGIGIAKAGTTWLANCLSEHPSICMAGARRRTTSSCATSPMCCRSRPATMGPPSLSSKGSRGRTST